MVERLRIGERFLVLHIPSMHDVAHGDFGVISRKLMFIFLEPWNAIGGIADADCEFSACSPRMHRFRFTGAAAGKGGLRAWSDRDTKELGAR